MSGVKFIFALAIMYVVGMGVGFTMGWFAHG